MLCPTVEGGQLKPVPYLPELTADGFLNPDRSFKSFIRNDNHFSPVIQFRWGYKASLEKLQQYGDGIYLNEKNYWDGGPFANGCSALPDLWNAGLSDSLFLWLHIEHLNPTNDNNVYACPLRPYFVLAALRLARLVKSLREQQANVPITIVCHSQGNMIGMAAAFLGDRMAPATDPGGASGRCVADSYVLCNAPFSLKESNFTEDWISHHMRDKHGNYGRQTGAARSGTLRAFFDIMRQPACTPPDDAAVDRWMANHAHGFTTDDDRQRHGNGIARSTRNRVTQYCKPHDKVISATAIQGMGWRGLSQPEIDAANGAGVFCQRVFAQGFAVGVQGSYHYWNDHRCPQFSARRRRPRRKHGAAGACRARLQNRARAAGLDRPACRGKRGTIYRPERRTAHRASVDRRHQRRSRLRWQANERYRLLDPRCGQAKRALVGAPRPLCAIDDLATSAA